MPHTKPFFKYGCRVFRMSWIIAVVLTFITWWTAIQDTWSWTSACL
ncbi:MAG: hypothetical protein K2P44_00710 [Lachnospiraceae bacterium]|nr:hypothetical protein [Lachnospiraceae bacterium]